MLERGAELDEEQGAEPLAITPDWFQPNGGSRGGAAAPRSAGGGGLTGNGMSPYSELEGAVRDFKLSPVLQFHLWAYPVYRSFIESRLELGARVARPQAVVDAAMGGQKRWLATLPIATEFRLQAERAAEVPWIRFRTLVLKDLGQRPIGVV